MQPIKTCEILEDFIPDARTKAAISNIAKKKESATILTGILGNSIFLTIFFQSKPLEVGYNIYNTDWDLWANAMARTPSILRRAIETEAMNQWQHYQLEYDRKHIIFWTHIYDGCKIH